jgi:hypothetical protein
MPFIEEDLPKREAIRRPHKKISKKKKLASLFKSCEWLLNIPFVDENCDLFCVLTKSSDPETIRTNDFELFSKRFDKTFHEVGSFIASKIPVTGELLSSASRQLYKIRRLLERSDTVSGQYKYTYEKYNSRYFYLKESFRLTEGIRLKDRNTEICGLDRKVIYEFLNFLHLEAFCDYRVAFSPVEWVRENFRAVKHYIDEFVMDENISVYSRMLAYSISVREGLNFKYNGENKSIKQVLKVVQYSQYEDYDDFIVKLILLGCSLDKVLRFVELLNSFRTEKRILRSFFRIMFRLKHPDYFVDFLIGFYIMLLEFNPENKYYDLFFDKADFDEIQIKRYHKVFGGNIDIFKAGTDPSLVSILVSHIEINRIESILAESIPTEWIVSKYYQNPDLLESMVLMLSENYRLFEFDCSRVMPKLYYLYSTSLFRLIYLVRYEYYLCSRFEREPDFTSILGFFSWKYENHQIIEGIELLFHYIESQKVLYTIYRCSLSLSETTFLLSLFKFNYSVKDFFYANISGFLFACPERLPDLIEKYFYCVKLIDHETGSSEKTELIYFLTATIRNLPEAIQDKFLDLIIKGYNLWRFSLNEVIKFTVNKNTWIRSQWAENIIDVIAESNKKNAIEWLRKDYTISVLNKLAVFNNEDPSTFMAYLIKRIDPVDFENEKYQLVLDISPCDPRIYMDLIKFIEREDLYVYQIAPIQKIAVALAGNPAGLMKFSLILHEDPKRWLRVFTPMGFLLDIKPGFLSTLIGNLFREYKEIDLSETVLKEFSGDPLISSLISELKFYLSEIEHISDLPASLVEAAEIEKYYSDQLDYIRSRLKEPGKTYQVYNGLRNKRRKIEAKLADPLRLVKEKRSLVIKKAKDLIYEYMQAYISKVLDDFIQEVSRRFRLKDIKSLQEKIEVGDLLNALKISIEIEYNKSFTIKLIGKYIKGKKNYFDSHLKNQEFLKKVRLIGVDTNAWISGFSKSYDKVILSVETDPIKVLQMGNYFNTCLSQGKSNAYSTITNAIEVNKKVIYARDMQGKVIGRKLIAMTDRGNIIGYKTYSYNGTLDLKKIFDEYCYDLSQICNSRLINGGKPSLLLADHWYEDSVEPFLSVTFRIIMRLFEQYKTERKPEFIIKALGKMHKLNNSDYADQAMDLFMDLDLNEYNPRISYAIFRMFSEIPSERLFSFIIEKEERKILKFGKMPEGFFSPYNLARISPDLVVPFLIRYKDEIPGIEKVFLKYASFAGDKVLVCIDNTYPGFDVFPFTLSDTFYHFILHPPSGEISESNQSSIFRKIVKSRKYDHLFNLKYEYPKNQVFISVVNQILELSSPEIQDVINCFKYLFIIEEKTAQEYIEKYFNRAAELAAFFLDYLFITRSYEYFRSFESETILNWINEHVEEFEALMRQDARTFYDNFLTNRPVILALLDHVLGSHATSSQKLDSIRAFTESVGNIQKCQEVVEFIKSKASQNVYYRKAYQILKEKGL